MFVKVENNTIIIKNLNYNKLANRIKVLYEEKNLNKIFDKEYKSSELKLFNLKIKLRKEGLKIKYLHTHLFFALELLIIFEELYEKYNYKVYQLVIKEIKEKTWVGNKLNWKEYPLDTSILKKNIRYTCKPYQEEFIHKYNTLKINNELEGYLLSFDQGLGKTFTSIALSECLKKEKIIVVCPNSLKENWAYEIKEYFYKYENDNLFFNEVYVHGIAKYNYNKTKNKYIIINQESIDKIFNIVDNKKDTMIIVDECHNFRNKSGARTTNLLKLKELTKSNDVLMMSGTPIKSLPNEIIPVMLMIDPYFDDSAAAIYNRMFNINSISSTSLVQRRFEKFLYRKTKQEVLSLPKKYEKDLLYTISNDKDYFLSTVKEEIQDETEVIFNQEYTNFNKYKQIYIDLVKKYSHLASVSHYNLYLNYINKYPNVNIDKIHEVDLEIIQNYVEDNIKNKVSNIEYKEFKRAETNYLNLKRSCQARAMGAILPKKRTDMYIDIYKQNKESIMDIINNNDKKTIIFSPFLDVVNFIYEDLKDDIGIVKIVGETKNRMDIIHKFQKDDNIDILIATTQTLSTGVTLIEANQMFFFGTPWRSADYNQSCDRIYRIGQTTDVTIYKIILKSNQKNLSTRIDDILNWSDEMFNGFIQ